MPKRENTIDSSGNTTDFVRHVASQHSSNNSIAGENEEDAASPNLITSSFNNKNSKNSSFRAPPPDATTTTLQQQQTTPSHKRAKLDSTQTRATMSVVAHPPPQSVATGSGNEKNAQQHLSPAHSSAMKILSSGGASFSQQQKEPDNGHNATTASSSRTSSSASSPSAAQHAQYSNDIGTGGAGGGGNDEDNTSAIVNLITDNANYKVMDGVQVSKTNLIVNYVPQQMSQDDLQKLFERFGTLESCKLVRDKTTNLSLGYAFVNFQRAEDAEKALSNANGMRIHNKSLKVSYARPSTEDIKGANLYVSGIPKTWTEHDLKKYFYGHGRIITGRILVDNKSGLSKGVGFVRFDTREEAQSAINALNNSIPPESTQAAAEGAPVEPITVKFANNPTQTPNHAVNGMANGNMMNTNRQQQQNFQQNLLAMSAAAQLLTQQQQQQAAAAAAAVRRASLGGNPAAVAAALGLSPLGNNGGANGGLNPLVAAAMASRMRNSNSGFVNSSALGNTSGFSDTELLATTLLNAGGNPANFAAALLANSLTSAQNGGVMQQQQQNVNGGTFAMPASVLSGNGQNVVSVANGMQNANGGGGGDHGLCLFVYNLPPDAEESLLWQLFGPFGAVQNVKIVRDNITQRCKGFGFVTMANQMDAYNAMQNLDGYSLAGRPLQVKRRTQRGGMNGGSLAGNGFVGNGGGGIGGCM